MVRYADQIDRHLHPRIGPDGMMPGQPRLGVTPGRNEKRYRAGAYDPVPQRLVYVEGDRQAGWRFLNLLRALTDAYRHARRVHVILDNFVIHQRRRVAAWLRAWGAKIRRHFLPPYCPEANRSERLWLDVHANVTRNHRCRTIAELLRAVHRDVDQRFALRQVTAYAASAA